MEHTKSKWQSVVDQIKDTFSIVNSGLETFTKLTEEQWEVAKYKEKDSVLVNGFLPLDEGNLDTLKNDLVRGLTNTPSTQSTPNASTLFS